MVDQAALKTAMTLQKGYIDEGDQANSSRIQQLETTTEAQGVEIQSLKESVDIEPLKERVDILETTTEAQGVEIESLKDRVDILETGAPFFVAAYAKGTNDSTPLFSHGNKEILKKFDFFLLDTSDNAGEYTTPVGKLMKNNLLRFAKGGFAPVVGITQAMYDECTTNAIYTKAGNGSYTESYANGAYDADAQWEIDKALIAEGQEPTTLYKKVGEEYQPVSHVLRPWETTETKYTIGIAPAHDLYLLDNVVGTSGRYWKGIFTSPRIWDGIDISKYKVARTAIGPCPMTTVVEDGVTKSRCFFYLYEAAHEKCKSNPGFIPNNPFYNKNRHYPRISDVDHVTNMKWARANNANTLKSYPFAEGGWWATNAHIIALELLAETRYLHQANLFGSGISSNDGTNATNFYTSGGARLRVKGDEAWLYKDFGDRCAPYYYNANKGATDMSNLLTKYGPMEAAMESQLAASMATELGIAPTESADALNTFKFYGDTYYYMNVPGFAGLQDGDMNVKVYKVQTADVEGFNEAGEATTFEFEFVFRMSLFNGANLSGDIWVYNGGGLEMVGTRETDSSFGHHVDVYIQPDQKQWHHDSTAIKNIGETWDFEKTYLKVGEYETLGDSYTLERMSNSPVRIKKASNMSQGENYYMIDNCSWANKGQRARVKSLFHGKSDYINCSARYLAATYNFLIKNMSDGGTFQALIDPWSDENNDGDLEPVPAEKNPIDLGLPSGLKWASGNLGANYETDPGLYYMWGDTEGHEKDSGYEFTSANYKANGLNAISTNLTLAQDAANVRLGGSWRMPTKTEFEELYNNTNVTWTIVNGVKGCKFANKTDASKYIFIPAAGRYIGSSSLRDWGSYGYNWSSTVNNNVDACYLTFNPSGQYTVGSSRYCGCPVRAVLVE